MSTRKEEILCDRKFLHDMATYITVARTSVKKALDEFNRDIADFNPKKEQERLLRALEAIKEIENLHADQKARLYGREAG